MTVERVKEIKEWLDKRRKAEAEAIKKAQRG